MTVLARESEVRTFRTADTADSPILKRATDLAAALFRCPMASISLIDDDTQWLVGRTGLEPCVSARANAFCNLTIQRPPGSVMVIEDAALDPQLRDNPMVVGAPGVRFYAGAVLSTSDGFNLGALCVLDTVPRSRPTEAELQQLTTIAGLVVSELERARSERRRAQQQDMLKMAEAMSGVGHWRVRLPSGQIFWSDEVYVIHGVDPSSYDPQFGDAMAFYAPASQAELDSAIKAALAGEGPFELELDFNRSDGSPRRVISKGACAFDQDGQPSLLYGVFQDVTEQRAAVVAAQEAAAVKSDFLANMSHELRTPLTSIVGFTDMAMGQADLGPATRDYLRRIDNAGRSLMCLVNDILDFSKLEAGQVAIRPEPTDVERLSRDVLEMFAPQVGAKDLSLELRVAPGLALNIDPDRVRQILLNLVSNAVKFTQAGRVVLEMAWADGRLTGSVTDTGPGMTDDQAARLFQRFSQIDGSATRKAGGTGLGLAICKGLSEAMGGAVGVESTPGVGSRFWFEIAAPAAAVAPSAAPGQAPAQPDAFTLEGLDILVADDHPSNRELARLYLSGFGAEVTQAVDGREAADLAAARRFDLILMDARMPVMDGQTALKTIRQGGLSHATPILAFTADAHPATSDDWLCKGFAGVVGKPLSAAELITAVSDALAPQAAIRRTGTA